LQKVRDGYEQDKVRDGRFQAMMQVALVNDGPVTFEVEVAPKPAVPKPEKTRVKKAQEVVGAADVEEARPQET
jgi:D-tyrosyl-tRNA(Tyr) deacylase